MEFDCRELAERLTPYVDGEDTGDARARVEAHLAVCPPCRQAADEERFGRQVVRARAATLGERAPLDLRARCARAARELRARPLVTPAWRRPRLAAAAVLLVLAGVGAWAAAGTTTVLAAELVLDHLKCFTFFEPTVPSTPEQVAGGLRERYGWTLPVPPGSEAERLRLLGGRRCFSTDGNVAHILYRHNGQPLSLFMVPGTDRAASALTVAGYEAVVWSSGHVTYVVMGSVPEEDLARVVAYFRAAVD